MRNKEHKQLTETGRLDYVLEWSNPAAGPKRSCLSVHGGGRVGWVGEQRGGVSCPDSLNKMTEFIKRRR